MSVPVHTHSHEYVYYHMWSACIYCLFILGDVIISSGMTFSVDSDLNGTSPRFTLTCISTGGPATTVTWTRDSVTVTEGTETVLDNRTTSQYTHTLTVTGRLGGFYTCTVANNKPSEDSASYTVPGMLSVKSYRLVYVLHFLMMPTIWLSKRDEGSALMKALHCE